MADQRPAFIWFNGKVVPWEEATVHVWSEVALRGTSVFEGIRAYWQPEEDRYYCLALEDHLLRLFQSALLLRLPVHVTTDNIRQGIKELLTTLNVHEPAYIRPTLYLDEGAYGYDASKVRMGFYIGAFAVPHSPKIFSGIRCCVSTWRRASDLSFPPRVKSGAAYQGFRLPRIEAELRGYDEVIILNAKESVAETSGAAIFIVRNGTAITPPALAGNLESITRKKVTELFISEFGIPVHEREIERTELYISDEVFTCGTLSTIQPVVEIDGIRIANGQPGPITCRCRDRYLQICASGKEAPPGWLTPL